MDCPVMSRFSFNSFRCCWWLLLLSFALTCFAVLTIQPSIYANDNYVREKPTNKIKMEYQRQQSATATLNWINSFYFIAHAASTAYFISIYPSISDHWIQLIV